jgi:hypothetical protein
MAIDWISKVWKAAADRPKMVSPGELLILLGIADHCDELGRAYPAVTTLARKSLMTRRSAQKAIRRMEAVGILTTDQGTGGRFDPRGVGPRGRSLYAFTDPQHWPHDRGGAIPASHGTPKPLTEPLIETHTATPREKGKDAGKPAADSGSDFERFWAVYPRREGAQGRRAALNAWRAEIEAGADPEGMVNAARAYAAEVEKTGIARRYVKQAGGWLAAGSHDDYSAPLLPVTDGERDEIRWRFMEARFAVGNFKLGHADWNKPWILKRAMAEGLGIWRDFQDAGWTMPESQSGPL